jgi:hypothetical protein
MKNGLILCFILNTFLVSQGFTQELDSLQDSTKIESSNYLVLSTGYLSRANFMSRDFGQKIPLSSTELLFWHHSGIYLTAIASKFVDPALSWQNGMGLGYSTSLSPKVDVDLSYHHFFGASNLNSSGKDQIGILQGTWGLDWGILYSSTQAIYLVNDPGDFFLVSRHSRYFEFDRRIGGVAVFSFEPQATFFLGTSNYYRIGGYELSQKEYSATRNFLLQGMDFSIPLTLSSGSFEFQLEPKWVLPVQVPQYDVSSSNFQLALKATYTFALRKKP